MARYIKVESCLVCPYVAYQYTENLTKCIKTAERIKDIHTIHPDCPLPTLPDQCPEQEVPWSGQIT